MIITNIEPITKGKHKVFIDEQLAFVLYKSELSRYHIKTDLEITEGTYQEILKEILLKRGKARGLYLLQSMDKTKQEVRNKLKQNFYPDIIIDQVIEYLKSYRYIDDSRYTKAYIECKSNSKSKSQIVQELSRKGIEKDTIAQAYSESDKNSEHILIKKLIIKKRIDLEQATRDELQKLYQYLMRKGFKYGDIQEALKNMEEDAL